MTTLKCELAPKTCTCPCGHTMDVPVYFDDNMHWNCWVYDVCNSTKQLECPKCRRSATGGNCRTGEVTSWITRKSLEQSERIYQQQLFESEMNEWYGRGNW